MHEYYFLKECQEKAVLHPGKDAAADLEYCANRLNDIAMRLGWVTKHEVKAG